MLLRSYTWGRNTDALNIFHSLYIPLGQDLDKFVKNTRKTVYLVSSDAGNVHFCTYSKEYYTRDKCTNKQNPFPSCPSKDWLMSRDKHKCASHTMVQYESLMLLLNFLRVYYAQYCRSLPFSL